MAIGKTRSSALYCFFSFFPFDYSKKNINLFVSFSRYEKDMKDMNKLNVLFTVVKWKKGKKTL